MIPCLQVTLDPWLEMRSSEEAAEPPLKPQDVPVQTKHVLLSLSSAAVALDRPTISERAEVAYEFGKSTYCMEV